MNTVCSHVPVEFTDRLSEYWEVLPIRQRPGTVLKRLQKLLATAEESEICEGANVRVVVTKGSLIVEFDKGDFSDAEVLATLFALELGWQRGHGVLVGIGRAAP